MSGKGTPQIAQIQSLQNIFSNLNLPSYNFASEQVSAPTHGSPLSLAAENALNQRIVSIVNSISRSRATATRKNLHRPYSNNIKPRREKPKNDRSHFHQLHTKGQSPALVSSLSRTDFKIKSSKRQRKGTSLNPLTHRKGWTNVTNDPPKDSNAPSDSNQSIPLRLPLGRGQLQGDTDDRNTKSNNRSSQNESSQIEKTESFSEQLGASSNDLKSGKIKANKRKRSSTDFDSKKIALIGSNGKKRRKSGDDVVCIPKKPHSRSAENILPARATLPFSSKNANDGDYEDETIDGSDGEAGRRYGPRVLSKGQAASALPAVKEGRTPVNKKYADENKSRTGVVDSTIDEVSLLMPRGPVNQSASRHTQIPKPGKFQGKNKLDTKSNVDTKPFSSKKKHSDKRRDVVPVVKEELRVLVGSSMRKVRNITLDEAILAKKDQIRRESTAKIDQISTASGTRADTPFRKVCDAIMNFCNGSSNISKLTLTDNKLYRFKRFSLAVIPGCEALCYVDLISYLFLLGSAHCKMIRDMSSLDSIASFQTFDESSTLFEESEWRKKTRKCRLERVLPRVKESFRDDVIPPFLEKTVDVIQLATRLFQKFVSSDDEVSKRFIDGWYGRCLSRQMGTIALGVMELWKKHDLKPHGDSETSVLFELALRLLSKLFLFEMRQLSMFKKDAVKESLLIFGFTETAHEANVCRIGVREVFETGMKYLSLTNGYRREGGVAFIEMVHSYFTSLFCPYPKVEAIETVWNEVKESESADVLATNETFWTIMTYAPLQSALKAGQKIHEAQLEVAFAVAVLRHPLTCRAVFTSQLKVKETILDLAIRGLKEMSRDLLPVFMDIWEYKKEFWDGVTIMDLIKILLTYGFSQRELVCTSDERRNEFLDIIRDLITNSGRLAWELVGKDFVDDWWRHGPFGRMITTLQSDTEPVKLVRTINERNARRYAFSCLGWLVGSLGVSYEDGSREISKQNTINSLLQRLTSTRGARQLLEELLTIQNHLEHQIKIPVQETKPVLQETGKPKEKRSVELFSASDRANFSRVVEAVRVRICELKNISAIPVIKKRPAIRPLQNRGSTLGGRPPYGLSRAPMEALIFPDVTSIPLLQTAVVSELGYINREESKDITISLATFLQDESRNDVAIFDPKCETAARWLRLKRNAYVENARELLTSEERAVGQMCTCLPGVHTKDGDAKVGCVNDKCENRSAKVECGPGPCGAGDYCQNRRLQDLEYVKSKKSPMKDKGVGLIAAVDVNEGELVGEYQGEVISTEEFARRKAEYAGERHFYFMVLTKNLIIDASRKSQVTRFVNHSCDPNCEAQKWNAGGEPRVAIIAKRCIPKGEEFTFDYGAMAIGNESDPCLCGAAKCRGTLASTKDGDVQPPGLKKTSEMDQDLLSKKDDEEVSRLKQEKIKKATDRLRWAEEMKEKWELQKNNSNIQITELTDEAKRKLDVWKRSEMKKKSTLFPSSTETVAKPKALQSHPPVLRSAPLDSIRVPRLPVVQKNQSEDGSDISVKTYLKHIFNRGGPTKPAAPVPKKKTSSVKKNENENGNRLSKFVPGSTVAAVPKPLTPPQVPPKLKGILKPRSMSRPYAPGAAPALFPSLIKERPHVGPLASEPGEKKISVFKPSKSKFLEERKKRRPKIQPKKKTYRYCPDGENDSMAGYSTASDVSPCGSDYEPPPYYYQSWIGVKQPSSACKPDVEAAIAAMIRDRESGEPKKEQDTALCNEKSDISAVQERKTCTRQSIDRAPAELNESLNSPGLSGSKQTMLESVSKESQSKFASSPAPTIVPDLTKPKVNKIVTGVSDSHVAGTIYPMNEQNVSPANNHKPLDPIVTKDVKNTTRHCPPENSDVTVKENPGQVGKVSSPQNAKLDGMRENNVSVQYPKNSSPCPYENPKEDGADTRKHKFAQTANEKTQSSVNVSDTDDKTVIAQNSQDGLCHISVNAETIAQERPASADQSVKGATVENAKVSCANSNEIFTQNIQGRIVSPLERTAAVTENELEFPNKLTTTKVEISNQEPDPEVSDLTKEQRRSFQEPQLTPRKENRISEGQEIPFISNDNREHEPNARVDHLSKLASTNYKQEMCVTSDKAANLEPDSINARNDRDFVDHTSPEKSKIEPLPMTKREEPHLSQKAEVDQKSPMLERSSNFRVGQSAVEDAPSNRRPQHSFDSRSFAKNSGEAEIGRNFRRDRRPSLIAGPDHERIPKNVRDRYTPTVERGRNRQHLNHHDFAHKFDSCGVGYGVRHEHRKGHRYGRDQSGLRGFIGETVNAVREPAAGMGREERFASTQRFASSFHQRGGRPRFGQAANRTSASRRDDWSHVHNEPPRAGAWIPTSNEPLVDTHKNFLHNEPVPSETSRPRHTLDRSVEHGRGGSRAGAPEIKSQPKDLRHLLTK